MDDVIRPSASQLQMSKAIDILQCFTERESLKERGHMRIQLSQVFVSFKPHLSQSYLHFLICFWRFLVQYRKVTYHLVANLEKPAFKAYCIWKAYGEARPSQTTNECRLSG